jgi:hypothetical protein
VIPQGNPKYSEAHEAFEQIRENNRGCARALVAGIVSWLIVAALGLSYVAASNNDAPKKETNWTTGHQEVVYKR